jgi:kynurenine formamidase
VSALEALAAALAEGAVEVVDLSHPLEEQTPVIELPEPFANTPGFSARELAHYDERGPAWYWRAFAAAEHVGTHFDAPVHWVTGRHREDVASVPPARLIGSAAVIDRTAEAHRDADYLLTIEDVRADEAEQGPLPARGWLLLRTGWSVRHHDRASFLNTDDAGPHWPGPAPQLARWLAEERDLIGFGTEHVGIDAGIAHSFDPIYPAHHWMLGAGKYGLASLANLDRMPARGAVIVAAPLRIVAGSGSPVRVLALVPHEDGVRERPSTA